MTARTEADLIKEWKAKLGETKGAYYHHFWHQLHQLHMVWGELSAMHRQKKEALELVDATIPNFWIVASNSMWKEVIVGLCGYSDPVPKPRSKKPDSVSFQYWLCDHTANLNTEQRDELVEAIERYKSRLSRFKHVRDQYLGHWNADAWFGRKVPVIRPHHVDRTLKDIEAVLNMMEQHNGLNSWIIRGRAYLGGDTETLIDCLRTQVRSWNEEDRLYNEVRAKRLVLRSGRKSIPSVGAMNQ